MQPGNIFSGTKQCGIPPANKIVGLSVQLQYNIYANLTK